jgi:hypothetical protein
MHNASSYPGVPFNAIQAHNVERTLRVRGERNDACVRHIGRTTSVVRRRRRGKRSMLASNAPGTRPGGRTSSPTKRRPPPFHPSRRPVASLPHPNAPLFLFKTWLGRAGGGRSLNNFIYDTGYCTCPAARFAKSSHG